MDGINPPPEPGYAPELSFLLAPQPRSNLRRGEVDVLLIERAGFWERLRALGIDKITVIMVTSTTVSTSDMTMDFLGIPYHANQMFHTLLLLGLGIIIDAAYYTILHASSGQTIGKMIFNLRVVSDAGKPLSYGQALKRWLGSLASGLSLGLGYLRVALNRDKLAWHDIIAHTLVVRL